MMQALPEGRQGRLLAWALVLFAIFILWQGAALPLMSLYQSRTDQISERNMLARHMAAIAAELPGLRQEAVQRRQAAASPTMLLDGATDALASANLQTVAQKLAGDSNVEIASIDLLPTVQSGNLRRIGLHLHMSGAYGALVQLLGRIGQARPAMIAENLAIASRGGADQFDIDLTLYAFRAGSAASKG